MAYSHIFFSKKLIVILIFKIRFASVRYDGGKRDFIRFFFGTYSLFFCDYKPENKLYVSVVKALDFRFQLYKRSRGVV